MGERTTTPSYRITGITIDVGPTIRQVAATGLDLPVRSGWDKTGSSEETRGFDINEKAHRIAVSPYLTRSSLLLPVVGVALVSRSIFEVTAGRRLGTDCRGRYLAMTQSG